MTPTPLPPETLAWFGGDELRARIFHDKYALRSAEHAVLETTPVQMWDRLASGLAAVEPDEARRAGWAREFRWLLDGFRFIPGGRIMAAIGSAAKVTALNCLAGETRVPIRIPRSSHHAPDAAPPAYTYDHPPIRELCAPGHNRHEVFSADGQWRPATFAAYGTQPLYEITLETGERLFATAEHEWLVDSRDLDRRVKTTELPGHRLPRWTLDTLQPGTLVTGVRLTDRLEEVYCCVEPVTHSLTIQHGIVTGQCYVLPIHDDSIEGIFRAAQDAARTHSRGGGVGCVAKGAIIITRDGPTLIENAQPGQEVLSFNPFLQRAEFKPILETHRITVPRKDNIAITLDDGTRIITSRWHPTLVHRNGAFTYVPAEDLKPHEDGMLLTPRLHDLPINVRHHDPELGWWVGAHLGNGTAYFTHKGPRTLRYRYRGKDTQRRQTTLKFLDDCREVVEQYCAIFNARTGSHIAPRPIAPQRGYKVPVWETSTQSYPAGDLIDQYLDGIRGRKSRTAFIPTWILHASRATQLAFLAGLIDTDGHTSPTRFRLEFSTSSRRLAADLKTLLSLLGARSWLSIRPQNSHGQNSIVAQCGANYRVALADTSLIGDLLPYLRHPIKRDRLTRFIPNHHNRNHCYLPDPVIDFIKQHSPYRTVGFKRYNLLHSSHTNRHRVNTPLFCEVMDKTLEHYRLTDPHLYQLGLAYRTLALSLIPIRAIERNVPVDEEFCDLTVEGHNNYFAGEGGLSVIHNTDISALRPKGAPVNNAARTSTGAIGFMELFSHETGMIGQAGRRGATMLTIRDSHPDVLDFCKVKRDRTSVRFANISVRVTDAFMEAVERDGPWRLHFENPEARVLVTRDIPARALWRELITGARDWAEPGCLFWDTIERRGTSQYSGMAVAGVNPCAEEPLEPYGACNLGSLNLLTFCKAPFAPVAPDDNLDWPALARAVRAAIRFLDNVLDYNRGRHPLPEQEEASLRSRRVGLGVTALGDLLIALGLRYGSPEAIAFIDRLFHTITCDAYRASTELAKEKGPFPAFDRDAHLHQPFLRDLPDALQQAIATHGLRNVALMTVPPVGSGAALAGVSSGIEPVFALSYLRRSESLSQTEFLVLHPLAARYWAECLHRPLPADAATFDRQARESLPAPFVTAHELDWKGRVQTQAAIQRHVDAAISSTINLPRDTPLETVELIYRSAWASGCKGITVYVEGSREGILLTHDQAAHESRARTTLHLTQAINRLAGPLLPPTARLSSTPTQEELDALTRAIDTALASGPGQLSLLATTPPLRPRPTLLHGITFAQPAPEGSIQVTVNEVDGEPFELICHGGKAGSDILAWVQALARTASILLRLQRLPGQRERLQLLIEQWRDIAGSRSIGFGSTRVRSGPDGMAQALLRYLELQAVPPDAASGPASPTLAPAVPPPPRAHQGSPGPNGNCCPNCRRFSLITDQGCLRCPECGFKEC